jgi:hypothetical protein
MAVDPFHDVDIELVGMPDEAPGRSVIFNVTKNRTINVPSTITTETAWDAHISWMPFQMANARKYEAFALPTPGNLDTFQVGSPGSTQIPGDCLAVCTVPANTNTFKGAPLEEYVSLGFSDMVPTDGSALVRVIGAAFEVHNTTAPLNKSGSVTVYRSDCNHDTSESRVVNGVAWMPRKSFDIVHGPPESETQAKQMNGITWEAADGCLVPIALEAHNEPKKFTPSSNAIIQAGSNGPNSVMLQSGYTNTDLVFTDSPSVVEPTEELDPVLALDTMSSGAYFTGLSLESTLVLTTRIIVEVFPLPDSSLVPLAHPSTPLDAKALQCYGEIMHSIHAGYPVGENAAGDYFRKAFAALRAVGSELLKGAAAVDPRAAAVAAGFQALSDAKKMSRKERKRLAAKTAAGALLKNA